MYQLTITDETIEHALSRLAQQHRSEIPLTYKKLEPLAHSTQTLRQQTWNKNA